MVKKSLLKDSPQKIILEFKEALVKEGIPVEKLILFGSYAKRKADYHSDLDVAVVSKTFGSDSFREMVKLSQIANKIEPLIEPHPYNPVDLKNKWDPLAHEIRTHGIRIV